MTTSYNHDLFKGTAWYYARYRVGYPEPFLTHISERFQLDGTGQLLDLGCGTGQVALSLANRFEKVVGMDPEPEMIAEAKTQAQAVGIKNVTWIEGGSYNLKKYQPQLGKFKLVTMGSSFHWMDRTATLQILAEMVVPDGGIVAFGSASLWHRSNEWQKAVKTIIQRWLGEARRAGSSTYAEPEEGHEVVIARSPFKRMEIYQVEYQHHWDIESIIGNLYSTSFCSVTVLGAKRELFEDDLRRTLLQINPQGEFSEDVALGAFLAWKD